MHEVESDFERTGNMDPVLFDLQAPRAESRNLSNYRTPQKLPAISNRSKVISRSSHDYTDMSPLKRTRLEANAVMTRKAAEKYNQVADAYEAKLSSPKFCNNSQNMNGVFGTGSHVTDINNAASRQEHALNLSKKISRISHLL